MRAIVIDVMLNMVRPVHFKGTLKHTCELLSYGDHNVDYVVKAADLGNGDILLVDDIGLVREDAVTTPFFAFKGCNIPFAGMGLIVSGDENGDAVTTIATATDNIEFVGTPPKHFHNQLGPNGAFARSFPNVIVMSGNLEEVLKILFGGKDDDMDS